MTGKLTPQFELLYAPLFPPPHVSSETARRWRQNVISNAREVIRITEGKGIILSSGPGGGEGCLRGPIDLINLYVNCGGFHSPPPLWSCHLHQTTRPVLGQATANSFLRACHRLLMP